MKWPIRAFAITGIDTVRMISSILEIEAMRATPPSLRISAGTRSSAITAEAPAFSAILACSALVTSMMTPPFSISASPTFTRNVSLSKWNIGFSPAILLYERGRRRRALRGVLDLRRGYPPQNIEPLPDLPRREACKTQPQRTQLAPRDLKITSWKIRDTFLLCPRQQISRVQRRRQPHPYIHAAFGPAPSRPFG